MAVNRQQEAQSRGGPRETAPGAGVDKPADRLDLSGPEAQAPEEQVVGLYQQLERQSLQPSRGPRALTARSWCGAASWPRASRVPARGAGAFCRNIRRKDRMAGGRQRETSLAFFPLAFKD